MKHKLYQIDAFSEKVFSGNPAAVCPLQHWLSDDTLQSIAMENNLAETAFYVRVNDKYQIRWFTPKVEVDLCGHATLAAAYVLFDIEHYDGEQIEFYSDKSGKLSVTKEHDVFTLDFPTDTYNQTEIGDTIRSCFNLQPSEAYKGKTDYMLIYENEKQIQDLTPNLTNISNLTGRGVIVTAMGEDVDFVSRFFAPQSGINEDPVTGSAHTTLTPYWSKKLNKTKLSAIQLSERKGYLTCELMNQRVRISGKASLYMIADIFTP